MVESKEHIIADNKIVCWQVPGVPLLASILQSTRPLPPCHCLIKLLTIVPWWKDFSLVGIIPWYIVMAKLNASPYWLLLLRFWEIQQVSWAVLNGNISRFTVFGLPSVTGCIGAKKSEYWEVVSKSVKAQQDQIPSGSFQELNVQN